MSKTIRFVLVLALALGVAFVAAGNHAWAASSTLGTVPAACTGINSYYLDEAGTIVFCPGIVNAPQDVFDGSNSLTAKLVQFADLGNSPSKAAGAHVWLSLGINLMFSPSMPVFSPPVQVCFVAPPPGWNSMVRWQVSAEVGSALVGKWIPLATYNYTYGTLALRCADVRYQGNYALSGNYTGH